MNKKEILVELIERLFAFEAENINMDSWNMGDFIAYLNAQYHTESTEIRKLEGENESWMNDTYGGVNQDISILIVLMSKYAKLYTKKALKESPIQTTEEFAFLITLLTHESLTKTELVNKMIMEKTSGAEVLKRLLKQKLIRQFEDMQDKRSVRVAITDAGRREIISILPEMSKVSDIVVGNLNENERNTLAFLLKKLDYYHNDIFMNRRNAGLEELILGEPAE
ncbi:MAG: winged helix DNA-binding protein [Bacteroidia bacterium]